MFQVTKTVSLFDAANLLVCAFEGGTWYWCEVDFSASTEPPKVVELKGLTESDEVFPHIHWPLSEGGALAVREKDAGAVHRLDLDAVRRGLTLMATRFPERFAQVGTLDCDAETGDVFLQCALLGELRYS